MNTVLKEFLESLELVGQANEEIYDSEVRQRIRNAVADGFVRKVPGFVVPIDFGMYSATANDAVRLAVLHYVSMANLLAEQLGIMSFHDRLAAMQNRSVVTDEERNDYEEFLGHSPPEQYTLDGRVARPMPPR